MRASHYAWAFVGLGALRCDCKMYYTKPPSYKWPVVRAPPGLTYRVDFFVGLVALGRPKDVLKKQRLLTAADAWIWRPSVPVTHTVGGCGCG